MKPPTEELEGRSGLVPGRPRGLTLVEVLLVFALLVVIAALSWPALQGFAENQRLRSAAEQVRSSWHRARNEAIESGRLRVFRYTAGEASYRIEDYLSPEAADGMELDGWADETGDSAPKTIQGTLPEGIGFAGAETRADLRTATASETMGSDLDAGTLSGWSEPIFFYPDGETSTTRLRLRNQRGRCIEVWLRGETGVTGISKVFAEESP
jgi:Tfp pilus assembly protein FimT